MPILNYTTTVKVEKTFQEIHKILTINGARKIITDNDEKGNLIAVTFSIMIGEIPAYFNLPANHEGVLKMMLKDKKVTRKSCTKEQALRVSWRIIKDWIQAQIAIIQSGQAQMAEVFLPYAVTKSGNTLYKEIESGQLSLLKS